MSLNYASLVVVVSVTCSHTFGVPLVYALPALLPCVMATILFAIFVVPRRNHVALYLPTLKCAAVDKEAQERGDHVKNFACKAYLQPALKSRPVYPEGFEMPRVRIRTMSRDGTR